MLISKVVKRLIHFHLTEMLAIFLLQTLLSLSKLSALAADEVDESAVKSKLYSFIFNYIFIYHVTSTELLILIQFSCVFLHYPAI